MTITAKSYLLLALMLSGGLLIGAWIFQYGLGYPPCQMCYWQRHAHKIVIGLSALALVFIHFTANQKPRLWAYWVIAAFLISFALAFWHVGVEYKWFPAPDTCAAADIDINFSSEDLLGSLGDKIKPPSCADAVWHFLGLSMAGWNAVASLFGAALGVFALRKRDVQA